MLAILDPLRYAAANANVRGRMARLLPATTWQTLLTATDLNGLVTILNRHGYQTVLANLGTGEIAAAPVEKALWGHLVREMQAPLKLLPGKPQKLLGWLWRRFEVDNLKTILRSVDAGVAPDQIRAALIGLGPASGLPWNRLTESTSVSDIIEQLRGSFHGAFYARALDQATERYRQARDLFAFEVSLDLAYHRRLLRLLDDLSGRDKGEAQKLVGSRIDSQNLLWAFRYRVYFDLSPEEILNYTLQRRLRVDAEIVREIATGGAIGQMVQRLWSADLPGLERVTELPPEEALPRLQLSFQRHYYQVAQATRQGYPLHLGTMLAYLILLESDVRDLITIIEGQASGRSPDHIQSFLIGEGRQARV